ncbi:MAG: DUF4368 domain-containing protein [Syntrophobacterales bacterium]|nr:DUF4368 domain-containing protein [Syntrophobacterales bacterium]
MTRSILFDKVIIHETEQTRGDRRQKVEIVYHRIGKIDFAEWIAARSQNRIYG